MGNLNFFRRKVVENLFDQKKQSFQKRMRLNTSFILKFGGGTLLVVVLAIMLAPNHDPRVDLKNVPILDYNKGAALTSQDPQNQTPSHQNSGSGFSNASGGIGYGSTSITSQSASRSRNANQVIRRGANGNDPGANLSLGTTISATLATNILSTNSASPAIAIITKETLTPNGTSIPSGARVIGRATFDEVSKRIQIRFNTVVYPEGDQHSIQAMAMMPDGSAGISGDYHSGELKRQTGRFIGNFIGGIADGMKERIAGGGFSGGSIEPGSIKNGLLNGITLSAEDEAKSYSDDLNAEKPTMSINAGSSILLFLEKEYLP